MQGNKPKLASHCGDHSMGIATATTGGQSLAPALGGLQFFKVRRHNKQGFPSLSSGHVIHLLRHLQSGLQNLAQEHLCGL